MTDNEKFGDKHAFDSNWKSRAEAQYIHWTRDEPINQIQLAFRNHWLLFQEIMAGKKDFKTCLEVGCGRGSMSAYFSENGFDCTLLDTSVEVLTISRNAFDANGLKGVFTAGDAMNLPYGDNVFDVVVSIGLLEHFRDISVPIAEQIRVLSRGGLFLGYVVPRYTDNIQKEYLWVNDVLKGMVSARQSRGNGKKAVFRSDDDSGKYVAVLNTLPVEGIMVSGVYPLPMISHSVDFPFSLLPPESEKVLVDHFSKQLRKRRKTENRNPWLCAEGYGQAFLVWCFKQ